jgi:hypothetical protein
LTPLVSVLGDSMAKNRFVKKKFSSILGGIEKISKS